MCTSLAQGIENSQQNIAARKSDICREFLNEWEDPYFVDYRCTLKIANLIKKYIFTLL